MRDVWRKPVLKIIGFILPAVIWICLSLVVGPTLFPTPWETVTNSAVLLVQGGTWYHLAATLVRVVIGFVFSFAAGLLFGILRGVSRSLALLTEPLVRFFQAVPPLLWAVPVLFIAGFGFFSPVIVIVLITFPLITVTIGEGMQTLPRENKEVLALFAPRPEAYLKELALPHLSAALSASFKLGLAIAVKASIVGEFFGANDGAGFMLNTAFQNARIRELYAWGLIIIILIIGSDILLKFLQKALFAGREKQKRLDIKTLLLLSRSRDRTDSVAAVSDSKPPSAQKITLQNIGFSYVTKRKATDDQKPLLQKITCTIKPGEIALIAGDSGIGKTTLLKIMAGLLEPAQGEKSTAPARTAFMFQEDRLLAHRTAAGNVAMPLLYAGGTRTAAFRRARSILKQAGLSNALLHFPDELSGGMKRRVSLARCFSTTPSLILLDEPFHGLQKNARKELWRGFISLWREALCPAVIVTHYPEEIPRESFITRYRLKGKPALLVNETIRKR